MTINDFVARFDDNAGQLGGVISDSGMLSLIKGEYKGDRVYPYEWKISNIPTPTLHSLDTILYMWPRLRLPDKDIVKLAIDNNLSNNYCVKGTMICLFTNRSQSQLGSLAAFVEETKPPAYIEDHPQK